jgi:myo-inositol 2-dehydrogenase/D-chiro-inositol 1-dehydrogenase
MNEILNYGRKKLSQYESGGIREVITGQKRLLKLGIIGTGRHCRANLLPNLPFLAVQISSVCAAHKENAEFYGKKYGAESFYDDVDQMISEQRLDLIIASVNASTHSQFIKSALNKNIPIFVEKPVAGSTDEIKNLITLDKDIRVMVGFQKRFAPNYRLLKNAIEKKTFGALHSLHLEFGVGAIGDTIENFLLEVGIHFIDLLRYFTTDLQIESVLIKEIKKGQINCNIAFSAANDVIGNLHLSSNFDWSNCHERVMANFEKENITVNNLVDISSRENSKSILSIPLEKVTKKRILRKIWHPNYVSGDMENSSHFQAGFLGELKHFCNWVSGEEKNTISNLQNALATHQLLESILRLTK